jgi:hypothetical protein
MLTKLPSRTILFAGVLSLPIVGCTVAEGDDDGSGGTPGAGGAGSSGRGGAATGGGGQATGGTSGQGGTTGVSGTGGMSKGGSGPSGGSSAGTTPGTGGSGAGKGGSGNASGMSSTGGASGGAGASGSGGAQPNGGTSSGGTSSGGTSSGGMGGGKGGSAGSAGSMMAGGAAGTGGGGNPGPCTASKANGTMASGSGPHDVVIETNSDNGIKEGTIYRPADLGGDEKYPIFVWGNGACSQNGFSNRAAMAEIASYGYFVVADGTPNGSGSRPQDSNDVPSMGEPLIAYIDWAIDENGKSCSAYYQSLDTTKVASNGFSCGGLMAEGTAADPRITTWGITSSGMISANQTFYNSIHSPVLIILGGPSDIAYENGLRDYDNISQGDQPVMLFSKDIGHGGDLGNANGDFTQINLAWLNWWLKGDEGATGKGVLVGSGCSYCTDGAWETDSANIP